MTLLNIYIYICGEIKNIVYMEKTPTLKQLCPFLLSLEEIGKLDREALKTKSNRTEVIRKLIKKLK